MKELLDYASTVTDMRQKKRVLRNYPELPNGIPSHDTIQRVFAMAPSEFPENFQKQWNEMLNSDEGNKIPPSGNYVIFKKQTNKYALWEADNYYIINV